MPHTLLVSFSLLALVVTARPIVPVSEHSRPAEVQNAIKAIFEERTKQSDVDLISFAQDEIDIHIVSDENQQAVLSELDDSAVKALVPLEGDESGALTKEVQKLRDMLGGSKNLNDIEGASPAQVSAELEMAEVETVQEVEASPLTSPPSLSPFERVQLLTGLSAKSILAIYTLFSVSLMLFTFYSIRGFLLSLDRRWEESQQQIPADVEAACVDEKDEKIQEKTSGLDIVILEEPPKYSETPVGVLIDIDTDVSVTDDEFHDAVDGDSRTSTPRAALSELPLPVAKPWLVPLPQSPTPSPLRQPLQLHDDPPEGTSPRPAWAVVTSDDQPRADARAGNAATAVDLALAMQLRTGLGVTADAAWLMRFVMALFGWVAVLMGGGEERQGTAGRRRLGW
ncbi:hypothetical protein BC834DRAFT_870861 [Gloeopeniophorella convolvens]|nr:hypothetical protein BC834DRAFT_870861 [Gloeopeniophorella convolvens]